MATKFHVYLFADITTDVRGDVLKFSADDRDEHRVMDTAAEVVATLEVARAGELTGTRMDFRGDDGVWEEGVAVRSVLIFHALNGREMGQPEIHHFG